MRPRSPAAAIWLAFALAAGFAWAVLRLLGLQFATGDVYPEYSSLRSDALGAKLLYDSLARLPALLVTRSYVPVDLLEENSAAVLLLGTSPASLADGDRLERIGRAARRGNRIVLALTLPAIPEQEIGAKLRQAWNVSLRMDPNEAHARRLYFTDAKDWTVRERAGPKLLVLERAFDKGSVLLCAASDDFANAALLLGNRLPAVTQAIGPHSRIVFDEAHIGIAESGSVMGLARRYRLLGFLLGLAICGALALWKNAAPFPPSLPPAAQDRVAARTSFTGLAMLLRRHIRPEDLAQACWREWLKSNRREVAAGRAASAAAIARDPALPPLAAIRAIEAALRAKGEH